MKTPTSAINIDEKVVRDFGREWTDFRQNENGLSEREKIEIFEDYFSIFPWEQIDKQSRGADLGCGSGRWAQLVAPKVGQLHLIDASEMALKVANENLRGQSNCQFHLASVGQIPLDDQSLDFAYSLGVLHHIPDIRQALKNIFQKLKSGAPFLVYLYYAFDNRPLYFRLIWKFSDLARRFICLLPNTLKRMVCDIIALGIYWPLARIAKLIEKLSLLPKNWPLSYYRDKSFYVMRTDSRDRFGTRLENRYTQIEIRRLMSEAGFDRIRFSPSAPFWCAVGHKSNNEA